MIFFKLHRGAGIRALSRVLSPSPTKKVGGRRQFFKGTIVWRTSKVMVLCWWTPTLEHFVRRHSSSVKLGYRTPWTGCSWLRREKFSFWISGAPESQLGPPFSLSLMHGPHLSSSSSSSSPLLFFHWSASSTSSARYSEVRAHSCHPQRSTHSRCPRRSALLGGPHVHAHSCRPRRSTHSRRPRRSVLLGGPHAPGVKMLERWRRSSTEVGRCRWNDSARDGACVLVLDVLGVLGEEEDGGEGCVGCNPIWMV